MLSFDIRELDSKAAQVNDDLPAGDSVWIDGDPRPQGAVHVEGRISAAGEDRFYFSGRLTGTAQLECSRCLTDVAVPVDESAHYFYAPVGDETAQDDPDVYLYDPAARDLDLRPAVRESWLLAAPAFTLCQAECKGLCPECGTDLNTGACNCAAENADPRWDALRDAARDPSRP